MFVALTYFQVQVCVGLGHAQRLHGLRARYVLHLRAGFFSYQKLQWEKCWLQNILCNVSVPHPHWVFARLGNFSFDINSVCLKNEDGHDTWYWNWEDQMSSTVESALHTVWYLASDWRVFTIHYCVMEWWLEQWSSASCELQPIRLSQSSIISAHRTWSKWKFPGHATVHLMFRKTRPPPIHRAITLLSFIS